MEGVPPDLLGAWCQATYTLRQCLPLSQENALRYSELFVISVMFCTPQPPCACKNSWSSTMQECFVSVVWINLNLDLQIVLSIVLCCKGWFTI